MHHASLSRTQKRAMVLQLKCLDGRLHVSSRERGLMPEDGTLRYGNGDCNDDETGCAKARRGRQERTCEMQAGVVV